MENTMIAIIPFNSTKYDSCPFIMMEMLEALIGNHWYEHELLYAREEMDKLIKHYVNSERLYAEYKEMVLKDFYVLQKNFERLFDKECKKPFPVLITWEPHDECTYVYFEIDPYVWSTNDDYNDCAIQ